MKPLVFLFLIITSAYGQDDRPVPTAMRHVNLQPDSAMHVDVQNTFRSYIHLSQQKPVWGLWQLTVTNFGPGEVSVDGNYYNPKSLIKTINGKREAVFIHPGCFGIFTRVGDDYAWDPKPLILHQGLLINSGTCHQQSTERPYTDAEWADMVAPHNEILPHEVPAWVNSDESNIMRCVLEPDRAREAQQIYVAVRKSITEGSKSQMEEAIKRVNAFANAYKLMIIPGKAASTLPQSPGCDVNEYADHTSGRLFGITLRGMPDYETP